MAETRGNFELSVNRQSRESPRNQGSQLVMSSSLGISILLSSFPSVHTVWGALTAILCVTVVTQPKGHGPQSQVPLRPDLEKLQSFQLSGSPGYGSRKIRLRVFKWHVSKKECRAPHHHAAGPSPCPCCPPGGLGRMPPFAVQTPQRRTGPALGTLERQRVTWPQGWRRPSCGGSQPAALCLTRSEM